MSHETSQEGFYAEWRVVSVLTLKGDMVDRAEVFDERTSTLPSPASTNSAGWHRHWRMRQAG
jgi:hypothetical protein